MSYVVEVDFRIGPRWPRWPRVPSHNTPLQKARARSVDFRIDDMTERAGNRTDKQQAVRTPLLQSTAE